MSWVSGWGWGVSAHAIQLLLYAIRLCVCVRACVCARWRDWVRGCFISVCVSFTLYDQVWVVMYYWLLCEYIYAFQFPCFCLMTKHFESPTAHYKYKFHVHGRMHRNLWTCVSLSCYTCIHPVYMRACVGMGYMQVEHDDASSTLV